MQYQIATFKRKSPFINGLREKMRLMHLSPRTEDAYVHWVADFCAWTDWKKPDAFDTADVTAYLTRLAVDRHVSASTQNQAFNALLFLFRNVLGRDMGDVKAMRAKPSVNVPEWLTHDEVVRVLAQLNGDYKLLARVAYGTGLRLMELLRLRLKDVDLGNNLINVRRGKGAKDRQVPFPKSLLIELRDKIASVAGQHSMDTDKGFGWVHLPDALERKYPRAPYDVKWQYLFPSPNICTDPATGKKGRHHLFETGFQTALKRAGERAGIHKRVHPHVFRHSFATHFLELGGNIITLQQILGHKEISTTMRYAHCVDLSRVRLPLDHLPCETCG